MDGSLDSSWMQYLPELLGPNKSLTLSDGEHLLMNEASFKLVLETGSLEQASPASLLNSVSERVVYNCKDLSPHEPIKNERMVKTLDAKAIILCGPTLTI